MSNPSIEAVIPVPKKLNAFTLGAFAIVLPNVWSFAAQALIIGIYAGGLPVLIYGSLICGLLLSILALSFAEFTSAYPSAAGCTLIATKLGGPRFDRLCGFMTGGLHALASLTAPPCLIVSATPFITTIGMIIHPDWTPTKWQVFLITQLLNVLSTGLCVGESKILDLISISGAVILFCLYFTSIGVIVGSSDAIAPSEVVWKDVQNVTAWSNGLAFLIGAATPLSGFGPIHWILNMVDEVKEPRRSIPIALLIQQVGNVSTLFAYLVAIGYGIGTNWDAVINSPYPAPIGAILEIASGSKPGTVTLMCLMIILNVISNASYMNASLKLIHGFVETGCVPFTQWLSYYNIRFHTPTHILYLVFGTNCLLPLLEFGSSSVLATLVQAATALYVFGYLPMFIGYLLTGGHYQGTSGHFRLPRAVSLTVAAFNICSLLVQALMLCLPPNNPITPSNMNWAPAIVGGLVIALALSWCFYGYDTYMAYDENETLEGREVPAWEESKQKATEESAKLKDMTKAHGL